MRMRSLLLAATTALCATSAHAIQINEAAFLAAGGDPANIDGTAVNVFDALRTASLAPAFHGVGRVGECTAVWLADDWNVHWVLTAATCAPNTTQLVQAADDLYFTTHDGRTIAGGPGSTSFIHPNRINRPGGIDDAGSDIALLRLRSLAGFQTLPPVLNDANVEVGSTVAFVGHGPVGINGMPVEHVWPAAGPRRIWGESTVDRLLEDAHVLSAGFAVGSLTHWARTDKADAGTPWWGNRNGAWHLFALTSDGNVSQSDGVRIAQYAEWISGLVTYSSLSSALPLDQSGAHFTQDMGNFISDDTGPQVRFQIAPGQAVPLSHHYVRDPWTIVRVPVRDARTGREDVMVLRASRVNGCWEVNIHDDRSCYPGDASKLKVQHVASDHYLPHGQWRGSVTFDALDRSTKVGQITLNIDYAPAAHWVMAKVERYSPFVEAIPQITPLQDVYFTVPTQAGASGPSGGHVTTVNGYTLITVHAREGVTQSTVPIKLRASRRTDCGLLAINNGLACYTSRVEVWFEDSDNPGLAPGRYRGSVELLGRNWDRFTAPFVLPMRVPVDINTLVPTFMPGT